MEWKCCSKSLLSNRLLDNFVHWIREVADPNHMGEDTRHGHEKETNQVRRDRLVSILMSREKSIIRLPDCVVYSGLSVSEIRHNSISSTLDSLFLISWACTHTHLPWLSRETIIALTSPSFFSSHSFGQFTYRTACQEAWTTLPNGSPR